ncbi:hypothetical protein C8J57DRAFT_1222273 [Mycena rebaudengoi]|nr:hypothetical protein C8J57DRAFT_1222273 [Mycena rebaudengoi]
MALPMCEKLILMLKNLARELDELSIRIRKPGGCFKMSGHTRMYALVMVLNPTSKLRWLRGKLWTAQDFDNTSSAIRTQEKAETECCAIIQDKHIVGEELANYEAEEIFDELSPGSRILTFFVTRDSGKVTLCGLLQTCFLLKQGDRLHMPGKCFARDDGDAANSQIHLPAASHFINIYL